MQDGLHPVGDCWGFCPGVGLWGRGVAVVGCIDGVLVHVGSARLGGHRGVTVGGISDGVFARSDGGEVHLDGGLGPEATGLGGAGWAGVRRQWVL